MITVQIDSTALIKTLTRAEHTLLSDLRDFWQTAGEDVMKDTFELLFESEGAVGQFQKWHPLSPAYARQKRATYPNAGILERRGDLRKSLTQTPIVNTSRAQMTYSTAVPYAKYHEYGTGNIPARPIFARAAVIVAAPMRKALNAYLKKRMEALTP